MIKRICLYGAPGSGKSTLMNYLMFRLKADSYNVEQVIEKAKEHVYQGLNPDHFDGINWMIRQMKKESVYIKGGADLVVTDSPVYLSALYSKYFNSPYKDEMLSIAEKYDKEFPAIHVFIPQKYEYVEKGRYQDKKAADDLHNFFFEQLAWYIGQHNFYGIYHASDEQIIYKNINILIESHTINKNATERSEGAAVP